MVEDMFDTLIPQPSRRGPGPAAVGLRRVREQVLGTETAPDEAGLIDQIDELERLKASAASVQARLTVDLDARRQAAREARLLLDEEKHRGPHPDSGLGREIGLARHESPHEGRRKLGLARALLHDLPETLAALERGDLNERRAQIIASETSDLRPGQRREVDRIVCDDLDGTGDHELRDAVRREVLRLDEGGYLARHRRAHSQRRVTSRHLGDGMARLSAVVSARDATAIVLSLDEGAELARHDGDERTRGQLVADLLVDRLAGLAVGKGSPVALKLLVSAETLLGDASEPGYVLGCGPVPASVARAMAREGVRHLRSSIQRLFTMPGSGALVAMESASTLYRHSLGEFLTLRDRRCRTPWCNAPVRHRDHVVPRHRGGETAADNGQGLCEACNYAKESPGWRHEPMADPLAVTEITVLTPTGHRHRSRAPSPPVDRTDPSPMERRLSSRLLTLSA